MNGLRRSLLGFAARAMALAAAGAAGWLRPVAALAGWNKAGFEAKAVADALKHIGATGVVESRDIAITAPDVAENGAVVPVTVTSRLPSTQQIAVIVDKNPFPLVATFDIADGVEGHVSTRIKMGQTSDVRAVVKAGGKYYSARKEVKITVGGCG